ncbi:hypothetical protein ACFL59_06190, partial [Planctomycetota bacterium]
ILRRAYAGRYQWHAPTNALALEIGSIRTFPIEKVRQVARGESGTTLEGYVLILAKRLSGAQTRDGTR